MAYAAAIGARFVYMDDTAPGGPLIPPFFCVVPEWSVLNGQSYYGALGLDPDTRRRGVHVLQDTRFYRPIRAPVRLRTTGSIIALRPTSRGALVTVRLTTSDSEGMVAETLWKTIYLGLDCEAAGAEPAPDMVPMPGDGKDVAIPVAPGFAHLYTECAGIWNPIHTERAVAASIGLPDIITHGTALWALAGEALIDAFGAGDPARVRRLSCRFKGPVVPGTGMVLRTRGMSGGACFEARADHQLVLINGILETD